MSSEKQPRVRPAYTYVAKRKYWRFRYKGFEAPLPGQPGEVVFEEKYAEFLARTIRPAPVSAAPIKGTFDYVLRKFYEDVEFRALSARTQANYYQFGKEVSKYLGDCSMELTTVEMLASVRNTMRIGYAEVIRRFISRLYVFAGDRRYVTPGLNVASCLRPIKRKKAGHEPWSDDEIALMLQHAKGSIRTLIIMALCTGQRPGDVEQMAWSQVLGDFIRVRQRKTGELLQIPMHPMLRAELDRLRAEGAVSGSIVRRKNGKPLGLQGFNYRLRTLIGKIPNMPKRTPHGGRYAAAAILEDAGCSVEEIASIIGHRTYEMAMMYLTKRKRADRAMAKMIHHAALSGVKPAGAAPSRSVLARALVEPSQPKGRVSLAKAEHV